MVSEVWANLVLAFRVVHGDKRATTTGAKAPGLGARTLGAQLKYVGCQVGVGIRGPGDHQLTQLCAISVSLNLPD